MKTVRVSWLAIPKEKRKRIEKVSCGLKMPSKYSLNI